MSIRSKLVYMLCDEELTHAYIDENELHAIRQLLDRVIHNELRASEKPLRLVNCIELIVNELEARRELAELNGSSAHTSTTS